MTKLDPILAVKDVETSSKWYQTVFGCKGMHGGKEFEVLIDDNGEVLLCLHKWGAHDHATMKNPDIKPGNGLILYFRTEGMKQIRKKLKLLDYSVAEEIQLNPNSRRREFSVVDPDGYFLTISEFHEYEG
ncbi:MAG: glyoxalase [Flavobacteriaceae bacterium]